MTGPETVLVAGPPRAGVSGVVAELRRRMPSHRFVEAGETGAPQRPAVVVFVVSAVAPITRSDCVLADRVAASTDAVVAVLAKIDDHRDWTAVLEANRECLAGHAGRFGRVPWVGAAAAPRLGEPRMDELVALLRAQLDDPTRAARNALRALESRECLLRGTRDRLVQRRRREASERATALRSAIQQSRLTLTHTARRRCAELRTDLLAEATAVGRGEVCRFAHRARRRSAEVLAAVEADLTAYTHDAPPRVTAPLLLPDPPLRARRLETRLMTVLGAGFGFGVAVVVTRFLAGLAPEFATAALTAGAAIGLATTAWVIRARALLHDRAVLERWAADGVAALRAAVEERVAAGMLAAETAIAAERTRAAAARDGDTRRRIAAIEAELHELSQARMLLVRRENLLPVGRPPGGGHLNRSCE
ncbi:hypothetical protein ACORG1_01340 [Mycobacterium sp. TJFP1]|uniref:hypothetical protein n=1 Tax=Mycolicibacterium austroafricanum TaxID=39687 RepID=UPI000CF9B904|nr:hypothetical protein [Mycolicibacterium austroafricanum]PQP46262.1 hypothetical protein C6A88_18335 [Mycolicibacterium austroafricanum]